MKAGKLQELLAVYDKDMDVDFVIYDEQDNWAAKLVINEYENTLSVELMPEDDTLILTPIKEQLMSAVYQIMRFQTDRELHLQPYNWSNEAKNVLEEVCEADGMDIPKELRSTIFEPILTHMRALVKDFTNINSFFVTTEERVDAHADQIVFNVGAIMKLGYDPELVLLEVAKEINSRKGEMINGKFEKFLGKAHTKNWYKANFTNCKLIS